MSRSTSSILMLMLLAGCSGSGNEQGSSPDDAAAGRVLTSVDLDRFLKVVEIHEGAMIPEFTPPEEDESLDLNAPAGELVASFQAQCRRLFNVDRQGGIWKRDTQWSRALAGSQISAQRFAALVRDVSLAIMRVRLEARVNVETLVKQGRGQVDRALPTTDEIDEPPPPHPPRQPPALPP